MKCPKCESNKVKKLKNGRVECEECELVIRREFKKNKFYRISLSPIRIEVYFRQDWLEFENRFERKGNSRVKIMKSQIFWNYSEAHRKICEVREIMK